MGLLPRIAVVGDFNPGTMDRFGGDEAHHFLNARYCDAISDSGGLPWLLPVSGNSSLVDAYLDQVDGILLTGCGRHLNPQSYGETPRVALNLMAPAKQQLEFALIHAAMARNLPMLGICGGMQSLNVALGGSLIQRIDDANPITHMQTRKATHTVHDIQVTEHSLLHRITGSLTLSTNSSHTQAVGRLGLGLNVCARSADGMIEAVEASGNNAGWLLGVQWHPEYLYPEYLPQQALFNALLGACRPSS